MADERATRGRTAVVQDKADDTIGLPDRKYFKIGEVAALLTVEPHVLRYWETQFSQLKPHKARSGHRLYRRRDVETLLVIKDLLHVQRFTIAGAKQALRQQGTSSLLPRAAEQLTLPPTPSLQARHTRVLESTLPSPADEVVVDDDAVDANLDEDDDVLELHLADPVTGRHALVRETKIEIVAADGDELDEALARQLARQGNASVVPVEVRAAVGTGDVREALVAARFELEALLLRLRPAAPARR